MQETACISRLSEETPNLNSFSRLHYAIVRPFAPTHLRPTPVMEKKRMRHWLDAASNDEREMAVVLLFRPRDAALFDQKPGR